MNQLSKLEKAFLKKYTLKDIASKVSGELNEFSCEHGTVFFGNREAILSPADEELEEITLFVDVFGGRLVLVRG